MPQITTTQLRYEALLEQLKKLIVPTGGLASFTLKECESDFIKDLSIVKDIPVTAFADDSLFLTFSYDEKITITLISE